MALWLQNGAESSDERARIWETLPRVSLAESYALADVARLVQEQREIEDRARARRFYDGLQQEHPAAELASCLGAGVAATRRAIWVADWLDESIDPWLPMRGYRALAVATGDPRYEERAFSALARLVRAHTLRSPVGRVPEPQDRPSCTVQAAARLDFGGGWSDTPPYSLEQGGTVLNAAITLNGVLPIMTTAEVLAEPVIELVSQDLQTTCRPRYVGDVLAYANPADPFALAKAALVFRGVIPADARLESELVDWMRQLGYGLRLTTGTSIPRGSGLGTSSILAGAVLQALGGLLGVEVTRERLFDEVLCLEQMITTGGGWQDQIGGLIPGIKLISTSPGIPQAFDITPVAMTDALNRGLRERLVLVHTGRQRLAKNLLRNVMGRWMTRDPEMVAMLRGIGDLARAMYRALVDMDLIAFGELIGRHWETNKRMDPGCTDAYLDGLMNICAPYVVGAKLAGAGGGGFAIGIAHDQDAVSALAQALPTYYPGAAVRLWPCAIVSGQWHELVVS